MLNFKPIVYLQVQDIKVMKKRRFLSFSLQNFYGERQYIGHGMKDCL